MDRLKTGCLLLPLFVACTAEDDAGQAPEGTTEATEAESSGEESTSGDEDSDSSESSSGTGECSDACPDGACIEGVCLQTCDPLELECPDPTGCSALEDDAGTPVWVCTERGNAGFSEECESDLDCQPQFACIDDEVRSTCQAACQSDFECLETTSLCNPDLAFPMCVDERWSCLGSVERGTATANTIQVDVQSIGVVEGVIEGATLRLCAADDDDCSDPLGTATSNDEGRATFTVEVDEEGFTGYAEAELDGHLPGLGRRSAPIVSDGEIIQVVLVTNGLAALVGGVDDEHGGLLFLANTCSDGDTRSVTARPAVEYDGWSVRYAGPDGQLDPTLEDAAHGTGLIGMLEPGTPDIEFVGSPVGVFAAAPVIIRPGTVSYLFVQPTP